MKQITNWYIYVLLYQVAKLRCFFYTLQEKAFTTDWSVNSFNHALDRKFWLNFKKILSLTTIIKLFTYQSKLNALPARCLRTIKGEYLFLKVRNYCVWEGYREKRPESTSVCCDLQSVFICTTVAINSDLEDKCFHLVQTPGSNQQHSMISLERHRWARFSHEYIYLTPTIPQKGSFYFLYSTQQSNTNKGY